MILTISRISIMIFTAIFRTASSSTFSTFSETIKMRDFCVTVHMDGSNPRGPLYALQEVIDEVHWYVCSHSIYSKVKLFLQRKTYWNDEIPKYLVRILANFPSCATTSDPKQSCKVHLSSMSRQFNNFVCTNHLPVGGQRVFYIMDAATQYSDRAFVDSTSM